MLILMPVKYHRASGDNPVNECNAVFRAEGFNPLPVNQPGGIGQEFVASVVHAQTPDKVFGLIHTQGRAQKIVRITAFTSRMAITEKVVTLPVNPICPARRIAATDITVAEYPDLACVLLTTEGEIRHLDVTAPGTDKGATHAGKPAPDTKASGSACQPDIGTVDMLTDFNLQGAVQPQVVSLAKFLPEAVGLDKYKQAVAGHLHKRGIKAAVAFPDIKGVETDNVPTEVKLVMLFYPAVYQPYDALSAQMEIS